MNTIELTAAIPIDDAASLTLEELSRSCACSIETLVALVGEGALEPEGGSVTVPWRFSGAMLRRALVAWRLTRDLGINPAGVALALDLLDEISRLRAARPEPD